MHSALHKGRLGPFPALDLGWPRKRGPRSFPWILGLAEILPLESFQGRLIGNPGSRSFHMAHAENDLSLGLEDIYLLFCSSGRAMGLVL